MNENVTLIKPCEELKDSYLAFVNEFIANNEPLIPAILQYDSSDFSALITKLQNESKGIGLPLGYVPASTFWLVRNQEYLLGVAHLRHRLTPFLEKEGGHIGFGVRPSERRKGYATFMLGLVLSQAKAMGLRRVLLTCDKDNMVSEKVIQKNGGIFDSERKSDHGDKITQRYWIDLC